MVYDYSDLVEKTRAWAEQACEAGWLNEEVLSSLMTFDTRSSENLFNQNDSRPLIVAFMGGSGVGKSTLLNRLAGKAIARTGIERPTSREITLYHHQSIVVEQIQELLPIHQISIASHDEEAKKNLIWIDMPDFDSVEQSNKQIVLQWLPYIDVLIYVVSPERYRDEKAWQLLLAEGSRHAWIFVLNQWDKAFQEQYDDFRQQLHKAGFYEPIIFKTACTENLQVDEFAELDETITSLATSHVVEQLEQRNLQIRKQELVQKLQDTLNFLGSHNTFDELVNQWKQQWQSVSQVLPKGLNWSLQNLATYYAEHAADLLTHSTQTTNNPLWDAWAQARLDDAIDEFINNVSQQSVPVQPLRAQLNSISVKAAKIINSQTELSVRQALANPGNLLQRVFLKGMRLCEIILPLTAMSWVGYQVFMGYYYSNLTSSHYLGIDFAVHSALLIAITWLVPFFILKKIQPSLKKSALRGLNKGLSEAINNLDTEIVTLLQVITDQHVEQVKILKELIRQCTCTDDTQPRLSLDNETLSRMLLE